MCLEPGLMKVDSAMTSLDQQVNNLDPFVTESIRSKIKDLFSNMSRCHPDLIKMRFNFRCQDRHIDFEKLFMLFTDQSNWDKLSSELNHASLEYSIKLNIDQTSFKDHRIIKRLRRDVKSLNAMLFKPRANLENELNENASEYEKNMQSSDENEHRVEDEQEGNDSFSLNDTLLRLRPNRNEQIVQVLQLNRQELKESTLSTKSNTDSYQEEEKEEAMWG